MDGPFTTELLDRAAEKLQRKGVLSDQEILEGVYRPFIVEGPASWSDSWHAPRYAGGFHLHTGQDVLCRYGARVLAAETGTLEFGTGTLGGLAAYIRHADGSFLYYAHLSQQRLGLEGTQVTPGDVIGRCGATGDASVPHVHFGTFEGDGTPVNPMATLVGWLTRAEHRAARLASLPVGLDIARAADRAKALDGATQPGALLEDLLAYEAVESDSAPAVNWAIRASTAVSFPPLLLLLLALAAPLLVAGAMDGVPALARTVRRRRSSRVAAAGVPDEAGRDLGPALSPEAS